MADIPRYAPDPAHSGNRASLLRHVLILQFKLFGDALRDAVLVPLSLFTAAVGILFHKDDPWRWYRELLLLGRISDYWLDLFDSHGERPRYDIDEMLRQAGQRLHNQSSDSAAQDEHSESE